MTMNTTYDFDKLDTSVNRFLKHPTANSKVWELVERTDWKRAVVRHKPTNTVMVALMALPMVWVINQPSIAKYN